MKGCVVSQPRAKFYHVVRAHPVRYTKNNVLDGGTEKHGSHFNRKVFQSYVLVEMVKGMVKFCEFSTWNFFTFF